MGEIRFDRVKQNVSSNNALQSITIGYGYTIISKQAVAMIYTTFKTTPCTPTTGRSNRNRPKRFVESHKLLPNVPFSIT